MSVLDRFSLKGKVVILTGGAGLYGRGLASDLAGVGATLILASRQKEKLDAVAAEESQKGGKVTAEFLDLGDEDTIVELCKRVSDQFGRIDGLVNNAVLRPMKTLNDDTAAWRQSMLVNADGTFLLSRAAGKVMTQQGSGSIVNIGSTMGMIGPNDYLYEGTDMIGADPTLPPDYFFHKGGMINLTRYFASVYGPSQVRVNCLSPGGFFNNQDPKFLQRYQKMTFLKRMADPTDLGGSVIFLLSDASKYVTGTNLPVDGGYTAK